MTVEKFKEIIQYNEPSFGYRGKEYSICHPADKFYVWSEDQPQDNDLEFNDANDLLEHWMIHGRPFKDILPDIDLAVIS